LVHPLLHRGGEPFPFLIMALQTVTLGDAVTLIIPMRTGGAAFVPAAGYQLIFTAKLATSDLDAAAVIQKKSGGFGLTESTSNAIVALLPIDTSALDGGINLYCDIQAQNLTDAGDIKTVAIFQLLTVRDVTRDTDTSISVYTSEPPGIAYIKAEAQSGSFTAVANFQYTMLATGTVTDPATAAEGDVFTVFVSAGTGTIGGTAYPAEAIIIRSYESAAWKNTVVDGADGEPGTITVSDTAPVSPEDGALWLDSTQTKLYVYYNDGDSSQWVSVNSGSSTAGIYEKLVVVNQSNVATTLGGVIDSTKVYFIDGVVDLGATQITVPPTGMTIKGHSFDISGLTSSEDNYTMFVSESIVIGSGNLLGADYYIKVDGSGSKVYELYDATGFNAFEFARINYNDCSSLGDLYDYRQGFEEGSGRFGGSPSLTLHGLWRGGYRVTSSIVRSLAGTMTAPLFKAGTLFQMNSRFLTDINCDLPTLAPFCDFSTSSFPNPSTIQFKGSIFSRDGAFNANDSNIIPNLSPSDLPCDWDNNIGIGNTFVGGNLECTTEVLTSITTAGTAVDLKGTFTASDMQHFDSPVNGALRHTGINPKEFTVNFDLVIDGVQSAEIEILLIKIDSLAAVTVESAQTRIINNLQGGRDVAYFTGQKSVRLNQNDLVFWQVANVNATGNVTLERSSSWAVRER